MRFLLVVFAMLCFASAIFAQGAISGKVIDADSGEPLAFASIALKTPGSQQIFKGKSTDAEGQFDFKQIPEGEYVMEIQYLGYEKKEITQVRLKSSEKLKLGSIGLTSAAMALEEVVIQDKEPERPFSPTLDGMEVRPDLQLNIQGGSVLDALRNVPSINVSPDGGLSLRGSSSTNILINGRNSALAGNLDQIAASAVEKIEINTNPGAKYDAQGQGGVINIILKKGAISGGESGLSGRASASAGNMSRYNASLGLTYEKDAFKIYGSYDRRQDFRGSEGRLDRINTDQGDEINQTYDDMGYRRSNNLNLGTEFYLSDNATLAYEGNVTLADGDRDENIFTIRRDENEVIFTNNIRRTASESKDLNWEHALIYTQDFSRENQQLRVSLSHSDNFDDNLSVTRTFDRLDDGINEVWANEQQTDNERSTRISIGQLDYTHPLGNMARLETGWKTTWRVIDNDFILSNYDPDDEVYMPIPEASNRFIFDEAVHAGYVSVTQTLGRWQYIAGLRGELTDIDTELVTTGEENDQNYFQIFPSFKVSYQLADVHTLKVTYSRRIDRPSSRWLNPFVDVSDSLNITTGDPNLQPEFINSFEVGHILENDHLVFTSTLFYRHIENQVDYVTRIQPDGSSFRGPANLDYANFVGMEFISSYDPVEWWTLNGSITLFYSNVEGTIEEVNYANNNFSTNFTINNTFNLPWSMTAQVTFDFEGPEAEAQGTEKARYNLDFGLRKELWEGKGYLSMNVQDIFNTLARIENSSGPGFIQYRERDWQSRIFQVGMGYRF